MPEPIEVKAVLAKIESTYGTDATPSSGSDEIQVMENFWTNITIDQLQDNELDGMGTGFGRPGGESPESTGQFANFNLTMPIKGLGSAFSASNVPELDVLLRASGLNQSIDTTSGSETINYTPQNSGFESASIYLYTGNKEYQLVGCLATVEFIFNAGEIPQASFDITGLVSAINETGVPGSLSYPGGSIAPPVVTSAGFTIDGNDPDDFTSFSVDLQTEIAERPGGNATDGHAGYWFADMDPVAEADYEVFALGTHDPYTLRDNGTEFAWDLGTLGSAQYNQIDISGPAGRINSVSHNERNGLAAYTAQWVCRNSDKTSQDSVDLQFS